MEKLIKDFNITNLLDSPDLRSDVIKMIEVEFQYQANHSFNIDFYPLMNPRNSRNNIVITFGKKNEVVGHAGFTKRFLEFKGNTYPVTLIGGVAIKKEYQKKGLLNILMNKVINENRNSLFYILWSNLNTLYEKYGFYEAGIQIQKGSIPFNNDHIKDNNLIKSKFKDIDLALKKQIMDLYKNNNNNYCTFKRDACDWENIDCILSSDLYFSIDEKTNIKYYFFANKGQDLSGIIHEFSHPEKSIDSINNVKKWLPSNSNIENTSMITYLGLFKIGNWNHLEKLIRNTVKEEVNITCFSENNNKLNIKIGNNDFFFTHQELLQTIFGPKNDSPIHKKLFIPTYFSGLDSI